MFLYVWDFYDTLLESKKKEEKVYIVLYILYILYILKPNPLSYTHHLCEDTVREEVINRFGCSKCPQYYNKGGELYERVHTKTRCHTSFLGGLLC